MGKKSNSDLRQFRAPCVTNKKQKDYLMHDGIDEPLADEMVRIKRRRKRKEV